MRRSDKEFEAPIIQGYGMTEASPHLVNTLVTTRSKSFRKKSSTSFERNPALRFPAQKFVSVTTTVNLCRTTGESNGEIQVRAPWVIDEYFARPEVTETEFERIKGQWRCRTATRIVAFVVILVGIVVTAQWLDFNLGYLYAYRENLASVLFEEMLAPRIAVRCGVNIKKVVVESREFLTRSWRSASLARGTSNSCRSDSVSSDASGYSVRYASTASAQVDRSWFSPAPSGIMIWTTPYPSPPPHSSTVCSSSVLYPIFTPFNSYICKRFNWYSLVLYGAKQNTLTMLSRGRCGGYYIGDRAVSFGVRGQREVAVFVELIARWFFVDRRDDLPKVDLEGVVGDPFSVLGFHIGFFEGIGPLSPPEQVGGW